jgi:hypothetical protein
MAQDMLRIWCQKYFETVANGIHSHEMPVFDLRGNDKE